MMPEIVTYCVGYSAMLLTIITGMMASVPSASARASVTHVSQASHVGSQLLGMWHEVVCRLRVGVPWLHTLLQF